MSDERYRGIGMTSQRTRERLITRLREQGISDPRVLEAMRQVPRHIFVDEALASRAYEDTALPIGNGQTISQPLTVARMTEVLLLGRSCGRVLEIGTGSAYQTAVLATLVEQVFTVERFAALALRARQLLQQLGTANVRLRHGDGGEGWPEHGPYDGILVTAAPVAVPEALLGQLADGGRLVLPVGDKGSQRLTVISRTGSGFERQVLENVSFVPMLSGAV